MKNKEVKKIGKFDRNFYEDLDFSEKVAKEPFWEDIYRNCFPDLAKIEITPRGGYLQKKGVDRIIRLKDWFYKIYIDEKARDKDYGDIALEILSSEEMRTPGWILKDLLTDYVAYNILPIRKCYLIPYQGLKKLFYENMVNWYKQCEIKGSGFMIKRASSGLYHSVNLCLPASVLQRKIQIMEVNF